MKKKISILLLIIILVSIIGLLAANLYLSLRGQKTENNIMQKTENTIPQDQEDAISTNVISKNPPENVVTYEIDERLVGRYVSENDTFEYLEISPEGKIRMLLSYEEGYTAYEEEDLIATFFYFTATSYTKIYMTVSLTDGEVIFVNHSLSMDFIMTGNASTDSFAVWLRGEETIFKKAN